MSAEKNSTTSEDIASQLLAADSDNWKQVWRRWWYAPLRPLAAESLPLVFDAYNRTTHWQARAAQLYYSTGFSRTRDDVCQFALNALKDKSIEVRYRACGLLAFSRRRRLIPKLHNAIDSVHKSTKRYVQAAIEAIDQKAMDPFTALDISQRRFYHLPVSLPCRSWYSTFAEDFDATSWKWLRKLGFERQSIFQHDAFYRRGELWFHAYWEQYDVMWLFMLGNRNELEQSYVGESVVQPMRNGTLKEASQLIAAEIAARVNPE